MKIKVGKLILIIIVIVALVIFGIYVYRVFNVSKAPNQLFKKYLSNNIEQIKNFNFNPYDQILEKMKNEKSEININLISEPVSDQKTEINLNLKTDLKNNKEQLNYNMKNNGEYYIEFDAIADDEKIGLQIDELHDNYLTVKNQNLKTLAKRIGFSDEIIKEIPNKISKIENNQNNIELMKKYANKFFEKTEEQDYEIENDVAVNIAGTQVTANKYTLSIEEKLFYKNLIAIFNELLNDSEFKEMYKDNDEQISIFKKKVDTFSNEIQNIDSQRMIEISVYEYEKNTVKTEFITDDFILEFIINKINNNNVLKFSITTQEKQDIYLLDNKYENNQGNLTINFSREYNEEYIEELKKDYEDTDSSDIDQEFIEEMNSNLDEKITLQSSEDNDLTKVQVFQKGKSEDNISCDISFNFNPNIEIDNLTDNNSLILNDYSEQEFKELSEELKNNMNNSLAEKPNSFIQILLELYVPEDDNGLYRTDFEYIQQEGDYDLEEAEEMDRLYEESSDETDELDEDENDELQNDEIENNEIENNEIENNEIESDENIIY